MRILIIECDAEELRANRTVMDSITETLSNFTRAFAGVEVSSETAAAVFREMNNNEENQEDPDEN